MSAIPAVINALVTVLRAAPEMDGVQIVDGHPNEDVNPDVVVVGFSPDRSSAEMTRNPAGLKGDREQFVLVGLASSWRGDEDLRIVRERAFTFITGLNEVLKQDQTLGGACTRARLAVSSYVGEQTTKGPVATVEWELTVDAFGR